MLVENSNKLFHCEKCDYTAKRKGDFKKHLESRKHNASKMLVKILNLNADVGNHICMILVFIDTIRYVIIKKKTRFQLLWRHKPS